MEGEEEVRDRIFSAFKDLLSDLGDWRASKQGLNFTMLNDQEANGLEEAFFELEVASALREMNHKALGPVGFTCAFR